MGWCLTPVSYTCLKRRQIFTAWYPMTANGWKQIICDTLWPLSYIWDWIELSIQRRWGDGNKGSSFSMLLIALTRLDLAVRGLIHILRPCLRAFYASGDNSHPSSLLRLVARPGHIHRGASFIAAPSTASVNRYFNSVPSTKEALKGPAPNGRSDLCG